LKTHFNLANSSYDLIANALNDDGYIVLPKFLPDELTEQLYQHVSTIPEQEFKVAGIGRNQSFQLNDKIRSDRTRWLSSFDPVEQAYLSIMDDCRQQLNQQLFLGLRDYEAHFAHYKEGSYYQRHVDAFHGRSNRLVTTVFYLNPDWDQQDGGELIIYHNDSSNTVCRVLPEFGTMVVFLSEQFPHEVLTSMRDRYSIAGWFRGDMAHVN